MRIEYRICDLGDRHTKPVQAQFTVEDSNDVRDVCEAHVTTSVMAALLNGDDEVTVARIVSFKAGGVPTKMAGAPMKAMASNNKSGSAGGSVPNTEPCIICGRFLPTRQGLGGHYRMGHDVVAPKPKDYPNPSPEWVAWKTQQTGEVSGK